MSGHPTDLFTQQDFVGMYDELCALRSQHARLASALRGLYDAQNGPPLLRREKEWQAAMDEAIEILQEVGE